MRIFIVEDIGAPVKPIRSECSTSRPIKKDCSKISTTFNLDRLNSKLRSYANLLIVVQLEARVRQYEELGPEFLTLAEDFRKLQAEVEENTRFLNQLREENGDWTNS